MQDIQDNLYIFKATPGPLSTMNYAEVQQTVVRSAYFIQEKPDNYLAQGLGNL